MSLVVRPKATIQSQTEQLIQMQVYKTVWLQIFKNVREPIHIYSDDLV